VSDGCGFAHSSRKSEKASFLRAPKLENLVFVILFDLIGRPFSHDDGGGDGDDGNNAWTPGFVRLLCSSLRVLSLVSSRLAVSSAESREAKAAGRLFFLRGKCQKGRGKG